MPVTNDLAISRPCLVLALGDADSAADLCRRFRRHGWDVYQTHGGPEVRRLTRMLEPDLVILGVDLDDESGFLTCAKLTKEQPAAKVVLVSENVSPHNCGMAVFVGAAALVRRQDCLMAMVNPAWPTPLPAVG